MIFVYCVPNWYISRIFNKCNFSLHVALTRISCYLLILPPDSSAFRLTAIPHGLSTPVKRQPTLVSSFTDLLMKRYRTFYEGLQVTIWTITQAQRSEVSARFHFPYFGTATTTKGPLCEMRCHQGLLHSSPLQHRCSLNLPSMPSLPTPLGKWRNCSEVFTCGNMLMEGYKTKGTRRFNLGGLSRSTTDNRITLCKQELWRMETRQAYTCGICQHLSPQELGVTRTQAFLIQS